MIPRELLSELDRVHCNGIPRPRYRKVHGQNKWWDREGICTVRIIKADRETVEVWVALKWSPLTGFAPPWVKDHLGTYNFYKEEMPHSLTNQARRLAFLEECQRVQKDIQLSCGCSSLAGSANSLIRGKRKDDSWHDCDLHIMLVWDTMNGDSNWRDAFYQVFEEEIRILKGENHVSGTV